MRAGRPAARAAAAMRSISPNDSALMAATPSETVSRDFGPGLADAGHDDLLGSEAGAQRHLELADRIDVGRRAQIAQQAHDGQRRIRLQRVVQAERHRGQRTLQAGVALPDERGAVDVAGRADRRGNVGKRHVVAHERAIEAEESGHRTADCIPAGPGAAPGLCYDAGWSRRRA